MEQCLLSTLNSNGKFDWWEIDHNSRHSDRHPIIVNVAACVKPEKESECINARGRLDSFLIFVVQGSLEVKTNHGVADIYENDMIIIPPGSPYSFKTTSFPFCYLCVHFTGSASERLLEKYGIKTFPEVNRLSRDNHMQLRFKTLFESFAKNDDLRIREQELLLERLFIEAFRAARNKQLSRTPLLRSVRYINEFYAGEIRITDLAKMENMCMTAYNLAFKRQMGTTPTKYIIKLRMDHAMSLLETSNMSITEIGECCGYGDVNFFSRTFKAFVGISPSHYRAQAKA